MQQMLLHWSPGPRSRLKKMRLKVRAHLPLRMSPVCSLCLVLVTMQLFAWIWLQGTLLAQTRRREHSEQRIAALQEEIATTQKNIAALDSPVLAEQWARQRGWRAATQQDIEQIPAEPASVRDTRDTQEEDLTPARNDNLAPARDEHLPPARDSDLRAASDDNPRTPRVASLHRVRPVH